MKTRIISALVMLPLLFIVYFGGKVLMLGCFAIGLLGVREMYRGFEALGYRPCYGIAYGALLALYAIALFAPNSSALMMLWLAAIVIASMLYLFKINERNLEDALSTAFGIFYVVFLSYHVYLVDTCGEYSPMIWLIFLSAYGCDIMAYFSGSALGKHKLCPEISPKKSVEGAVGGFLGSIIFCAVFAHFVMPENMIHCIIIAAIGGIIAQFGDLSASVFKRKMGIKDYGNLIPGHGGVMDRVDSILFTAPLVYYYINIVLI